jgi:hypothetical protein
VRRRAVRCDPFPALHGQKVEEKAYLESLWPEMKGYWPHQWAEPLVSADEDVERLQRITRRIQTPDDPDKARQEALKRVMKERPAGKEWTQ